MRLIWISLLAAGCSPTLSGQLSTTSGEPISASEARINVSSLSDDQSFILSVEKNGRFATRQDLSDGEYLVEALVPGYKIESTRIKIGPNSPTKLKLKLHPLERTRTRSTSANLDAPEGRGAGGATLTPPNF